MELVKRVLLVKQDEKSNKFYLMELWKCLDGFYNLVTRYGKIGTKGIENVEVFSQDFSADREWNKIYSEKLYTKHYRVIDNPILSDRIKLTGIQSEIGTPKKEKLPISRWRNLDV
jgi:predicted DNA-binding WGR domain protein